MATDGRGMVYRASLCEVNKLQVLESLPEFGECKIDLTLACGNLQGDTARDVVSAAVQLGVRELCWVRMSRSQENYSQNKLERLQRVAIQATKQTGRARLLNLQTADSLKQLIATKPETVFWAAHPESMAISMQREESAQQSHCLIVGPEGGFDSVELELLGKAAKVVRLGQRRLRSETAVISGLTYLLNEFNEL